MGYYIHYGQKVERTEFPERSVNHRKLRIPWFGWCMVVLPFFVFLAVKYDWFIPGDPAVTKDAGAAFIRELNDGESIREAIYTFCKVIISSEVF